MSSEARSRNSSTSTKTATMTADPTYSENSHQPKKSLSDRTPLMDHPQDMSNEALRALSYLLVASIISTLSGMCLIFFSDDILDVLWESIALIILGVSTTVVTVLPGAGPYVVNYWKNFKCSFLVQWRHWSCCDFCTQWYARENPDATELAA